MKDRELKYEASLHICADLPQVEFIGRVRADSIKDLKKNARAHARSWDKHLFGRIHVEIKNQGIEFFINP